MITTDGSIHIKRYLAGAAPAIAQSIAFGIGDNVEAVSDTALQFEVSRSNIVLTSYDFESDRIVFKAPVPNDLDGVVHEVAIFSTPMDARAGDFGSRMVATFDTDTEDWVDAGTGDIESYSALNSRVGTNSLSHTPAASATKASRMGGVWLDFSGNSATDKFVFAYYVDNGNVADISFRLLTDNSNYYEFTLGTQTAGYKIVEKTKATATIVGNPSWNNINELRVLTTATASGAASVEFDAVRIEDVDTINPEYVMVAREVLTTPYVKQNGRSQDIEFFLPVNIT